jgi:uncharacterized coiled-coil protein SlyX
MTDREPLPHDQADLEVLLNADDTRITELEADLNHSVDDRRTLVDQLGRANKRINQLEQHLRIMVEYLDHAPPSGLPEDIRLWVDAVRRDLHQA